MRSLPILLIALALLPLSDALNCYSGPMIDGDTSTAEKGYCYTDYCVKVRGEGGVKGAYIHGCGLKCREEGCTNIIEKGTKMYMCCCTGNYCNPAPSPSLLLPSLAALAAVLAARLQLMRSLPILLIALALLPLSAANICYHGTSYNGDTSSLPEVNKCPVTCPAGHNHCGKFGASNGDQSVHIHQCVWCTAVDTCYEETLDGKKGTMCCCPNDLCNPAPAPSLLLPSLTALAAVLAAHF